MELAGEKLVFGNEKQRNICKWLEEDYKKFSKFKYLEISSNHSNKLLLVEEYKKLEYNFKNGGLDKYNKFLVQLKMNDIVEELLKPVLELRKKYYEDSYIVELQERRIEEKGILQRKFKRDNVENSF